MSDFFDFPKPEPEAERERPRPLPPAGPLAFVCEWPLAGIELTRVEVDAQLLIDAAARSIRIFKRP